MFAEKIERQIAHIETVMRANPAGLTDILPVVLRNLRGEVSALKSAEDEAFRLYLADQHAPGDTVGIDWSKVSDISTFKAEEVQNA